MRPGSWRKSFFLPCCLRRLILKSSLSLKRLDRMEELNMGPFPEQFGYVRSVQAALEGDSLRIPFRLGMRLWPR